MKYHTTYLARKAEFPLHQAGKVLINHISRKGVDKYLELVMHLETNKGPKEAITFLKNYQLYVRQVTLGITPRALPWHKVDRSGFPKVLLPWKA
jgi:hypothetical protein